MNIVTRTIVPLLLLTAGAAHAQRAILIDQDLVRTNIEAPRLFEKAVVYTDAQGDRVTRPLSEVLALLIERPAQRSLPQLSIGEEPIGRLRTTDGQLLFGRVLTSDQPDHVVWETMMLDRLSLPLDNVLEIVTDISLPFGTTSTTDDLIELRNGDELTGFIDSLRPKIIMETAAGVRSFEPRLVRRVSLANPRSLAASPLVAMSDGSVLACKGISTDNEGTILLQPDGMDAELSISEKDLVGVLFEPQRLIGLHTLGEPAHQPGEGLRWIAAPRALAAHPLGIGDLEFAGPTIARWTIPAGAQRFSTMIELPPSTGPWGACRVVVSVEGPRGPVEIASASLSQQSPTAELNADLRGQASEGSTEAVIGQTLRIDVLAGEFGPVQSRPILRSPVLLLEGNASNE